MIVDSEQRIVKLTNEVRALKTARELAYSQVLMPENTPTISTGGDISAGSIGTDTTIAARWRVRFTRTDGKKEAPFVDFTCDGRFSPDYVQFMQQAYGITEGGNDPNSILEFLYFCYVAELGSDYIDCYIDVGSDILLIYDNNAVNFSFTVEAISNVPGKLSVERLR